MTRRGLAFLLLSLCATGLRADPGLYSPNAYRGETFTRVLTWRDSSGDLVDLGGYSAKLQLRDSITNALILELTSSSGLTLGGSAGTITWQMTTAQTIALPTGSLAYDLRMTNGTGVVTFLLYGYVTVYDTRTR